MLGTQKVDVVNSNIVSNLRFIPGDNLFGEDFNIGRTRCKPWRMNVWNAIQVLHVQIELKICKKVFVLFCYKILCFFFFFLQKLVFLVDLDILFNFVNLMQLYFLSFTRSKKIIISTVEFDAFFHFKFHKRNTFKFTVYFHKN